MLLDGGGHAAIVLGGKGEIVKPSVLLTFTKGGRDAHRSVDFNAWRPEAVGQVHPGKRHLLYLRLGEGRKTHGNSGNGGKK